MAAHEWIVVVEFAITDEQAERLVNDEDYELTVADENAQDYSGPGCRKCGLHWIQVNDLECVGNGG